VTEKKNGEKIGMDCNDTMNMTYFVSLAPRAASLPLPLPHPLPLSLTASLALHENNTNEMRKLASKSANSCMKLTLVHCCHLQVVFPFPFPFQLHYHYHLHFICRKKILVK